MGEQKAAFQDLKEAREAKGLTLDDIFRQTRISIVNLEALEKGELHRLPPPVYTKNFIRLYARAVGVEEGPLLALYEHQQKGRGLQAAEPEVKRPWPEVNRRYLFVGLGLLGVFLAGLLIYAVFLYYESARREIPAAVSQTTDEGRTAGEARPNAPVAQEQPPPAASPAPPPAEPKLGKNLILVVTAKELTWLRIREDGNPPYEALLKPGDRIERVANDHFLLDIGNAGGITLTFQGRTLENLGGRGQVIHLRLPEKTRGP